MEDIDSMDKLKQRLAAFVEERDWDQFHNPKNLAMALAAEAGELLEHFQWLSPAQAERPDAQAREAIAHELADILMFMVRLADKLDIDLLQAATRKLAINRQKYPVDKARGRATKYDKL